MGNFDRGSRGGGRDFSRGGYGGHRDNDRRPQMHQAICATCGKECEVPFKPTGERPVYCRECFAKQGGGERRDERREGPRDNGPRRFEDRPPHLPPHQQHEKILDDINFKLDQILKLLNPDAPKIEAPKPVKKAEVEQIAVVTESPEELEKELGVIIRKKKAVKKTPKPPAETPTS